MRLTVLTVALAISAIPTTIDRVCAQTGSSPPAWLGAGHVTIGGTPRYRGRPRAKLPAPLDPPTLLPFDARIQPVAGVASSATGGASSVGRIDGRLNARVDGRSGGRYAQRLGGGSDTRPVASTDPRDRLERRLEQYDLPR